MQVPKLPDGLLDDHRLILEAYYQWSSETRSFLPLLDVASRGLHSKRWRVLSNILILVKRHGLPPRETLIPVEEKDLPEELVTGSSKLIELPANLTPVERRVLEGYYRWCPRSWQFETWWTLENRPAPLGWKKDRILMLVGMKGLPLRETIAPKLPEREPVVKKARIQNGDWTTSPHANVGHLYSSPKPDGTYRSPEGISDETGLHRSQVLELVRRFITRYGMPERETLWLKAKLPASEMTPWEAKIYAAYMEVLPVGRYRTHDELRDLIAWEKGVRVVKGSTHDLWRKFRRIFNTYDVARRMPLPLPTPVSGKKSPKRLVASLLWYNADGSPRGHGGEPQPGFGEAYAGEGENEPLEPNHTPDMTWTHEGRVRTPWVMVYTDSTDRVPINRAGEAFSHTGLNEFPFTVEGLER